MNDEQIPDGWLTCTACRTAAATVLNWLNQGYSEETLAGLVKNLCDDFNILDEEKCDQVVDLYIKVLIDIYHDHEWLKAIDVCGILLGGEPGNSCRGVSENFTDWRIIIEGPKPPFEERPLIPENIETTKVIHIADVHPDLHYVVGSLADCGNHHCCRPSVDDPPANSSLAAGPWGDYRDCDMPVAGVETIIRDAATRHPDAEFVLMTGDLTHHAVWAYTKEDNLAHYATVFRILREQFGDKTIYPVVGNHEPSPCNLFPTRAITEALPDHDISWVYDTIAEEFSDVLTQESQVTFREAGYYTQLHKPGFRIIVLNTNFCYTLNFWLLHSPQDPEGQLQWLSSTLYAAEQNNELVWILGHVPPGGDNCWFFWGQKYNQLINRFENIIRGQFYGHTHNDELKVFFDMTSDPPRPTGNLYITTSVTPYSYINPGYKVFYADGVQGANNQPRPSWEILDHEAYIYNVTDANLNGASQVPPLFREYSAKEEYGLKSFRPNDLYDLVVRMALDDNLFQKYYRYFLHEIITSIHPILR